MGLIRYANGDIVNDTQRVATSTWFNNTNKLTSATMHTSSLQAVFTNATSVGAHYLNIYYDNSNSGSEFSVSYGNKTGSGSLEYTTGTGGTGFSPSRTIYSQYRQLVFGDENSEFTFQLISFLLKLWRNIFSKK